MNYAQYERKIVKSLGVALDGWPIVGHIRNPGNLSCNEATILKNALVHGVCKWVIQTPVVLSARQHDNQHFANNGEGNDDDVEMGDIA